MILPARRREESCAKPREPVRAFSLVELLVVVAIIAILAALVLPVLARAKARAQTVSCENNLKQLAVAAQMYASDNGGLLARNTPESNDPSQWITGRMKSDTDATNTALLRQSKFFPYASQPEVFRCPADKSTSARGGLRARSYSMNSWMGSRYMETGSYGSRPGGFRTFVKDTELAAAGASTLWYLTEEHEATLDDGCFLVTMDDTLPFASFPAARHQRGYALDFVDGHAATVKLRDPTSRPSVDLQMGTKNSDWVQLKQMTTVR